jgi:hypothetical protein
MPGFTKLFSTITDSTVWMEPNDTRIVWIAMLAMADQWGRVLASIPGLAHRARVPLPATEAALQCFLSPDPYSRTKAFEGRRIMEIEGGWQLLNYDKYREARNADERREYLRQKQAEHRERQRQKRAELSTKTSTSVNKCKQKEPLSTGSKPPSTQAEAEAEAEAEAKKNSPKKPGSFSKPPELKNGPKTGTEANSSQEPLGGAEVGNKLQPHHEGFTEGKKGHLRANTGHSSAGADADSEILPEMVVSGIMQELRLGGMHLRVALTEVVTACIAGGDAPDVLKDRVVKRWRFYLKSAPALNYTLGFEKWIASGSWDNPEAWPWKNGQAPKQQRWKYADGGAD